MYQLQLMWTTNEKSVLRFDGTNCKVDVNKPDASVIELQLTEMFLTGLGLSVQNTIYT